ncbi:Uncharacterised protein [uncultured archaeon]|nr:Uncharacterised protein [uncultured archaeon]
MAEKKVRESKIKGNSMGAAGFTLGLLSVLALGGYLGMILAVAGFFMCLVQQRNKPTKLGKAGLILSVIGFILGIVYLIFIAPKIESWLQNINTFPAE